MVETHQRGIKTPCVRSLHDGIFMFLPFQIGLAVGDIESVQKNATLKRLAMQVINALSHPICYI